MTIALLDHKIAHSLDYFGVTTAAMNSSGANLITGVVSGQGDATSVTDSKGNTYTELTTIGSVVFAGIWYSGGAPTVGSGHTVTTNETVSGLGVAAWSGAATSSPFDQQSGTVDSLSPGSITPSEDNCLVWEGIAASGNGSSYALSGATLLDTDSGDGHSYSVGTGYTIQTTTRAINPTWTTNTNFNRSVQASFKAAAVSAVVAARGSTLLMMGVG